MDFHSSEGTAMGTAMAWASAEALVEDLAVATTENNTTMRRLTPTGGGIYPWPMVSLKRRGKNRNKFLSIVCESTIDLSLDVE